MTEGTRMGGGKWDDMTGGGLGSAGVSVNLHQKKS